MREVFDILGHYFLLAVTAVTVENAVFARALGIKRLFSLVSDTSGMLMFGFLLTLTTALSGIMYHYVYGALIDGMPGEVYLRALSAVLCISASFFAVFALSVKLMPYEQMKNAAQAMPAAAFNCVTFGTVMLTVSERMTIAETAVFSVGSSAGFILAVLLAAEGQRKLQNRDIPAAFKGLPATLLYMAGLALAIYGFTGNIFSI